jgi:hypothetical protein
MLAKLILEATVMKRGKMYGENWKEDGNFWRELKLKDKDEDGWIWR